MPGFRAGLNVFLLGLLIFPSGISPAIEDGAQLNSPVSRRTHLVLPEKGMFLVAARKMPDPRFRGTVILLLEHSPNGTLGVIINRATDVPLPRVLPEINGLEKRSDIIFYGGPVAMHVVILLVRSPELPLESGHVMGDVYYSASKVTLEQILHSDKPAGQLRLLFGHAGWAPGQLEAELKNGDWFLIAADPQTVFEKDPEIIWPELIRQGPAEGIRVKNRYFQFDRTALLRK